MTGAVEFTYLYNDFSVSILESAMTRAVRVKTAVKDKIKRVFEKNEVAVNNDVAAPVIEKESLIDLSHENLLNLNDILNRLEEQKGITHNANRAVLFTGPLVAKINNVTKKWFDGMPRVGKKVESPVSTEMPSVNMSNHLGGEVIPGNWNFVPEKEVEETPVSLEPTLEAVPNIPVMDNIPVSELNSVLDNVVPKEEPTLPEVTQEQVNVPEMHSAKEEAIVNTAPQVEIPAVSENTDIYRFPSFDFNMESVAPAVQNTNVASEEASPTFDFVPEPKAVEEVSKDEYVSEPVSIGEENPTFEMPSFETSFTSTEEVKTEPVSEKVIEPVLSNTSEMEDKIGDLLNKEFVPNPKNNYVPENVDNRPAETKIDELLGRNKEVTKTDIASEEVPATLEPEVSIVPKTKEEKPEVTQGQILARLQRINNTMADKDATIKSLTAKNDALREENAASKEKLTEVESRVSDLTAKNSELASQNERLNARVEEVEVSSKSTIAKLESKLDEVTQSKTEEIESLRKMVEELKAKHASELTSIKEKHAAELKTVTESKEKQIQAIYATISEALGETPVEEDYTRSMAA